MRSAFSFFVDSELFYFTLKRMMLRTVILTINIYIIKFYLFIYLFMVALGLRCYAQAFSSCGERCLLFVVVRGLLTAVASLIAEHGF